MRASVFPFPSFSNISPATVEVTNSTWQRNKGMSEGNAFGIKICKASATGDDGLWLDLFSKPDRTPSWLLSSGSAEWAGAGHGGEGVCDASRHTMATNGVLEMDYWSFWGNSNTDIKTAWTKATLRGCNSSERIGWRRYSSIPVVPSNSYFQV